MTKYKHRFVRFVRLAGMAKLVDAADLKSSGIHFRAGSSPAPGSSFSLLLLNCCFLMWFTIYRTWDLNTNERIVSFYKKELRASHIIDTAKKQKHYGTKRYRKFVSYNFPWARRYKRMRAIVSSAYKTSKKKYNMLAHLGMKI